MSEYKRGQAYLVIHYKIPLVHATVANFVKGMFYVGLVEDAIEQYFYNASCLGVGHLIRCYSTGIVIQLHGEGVIFLRPLAELVDNDERFTGWAELRSRYGKMDKSH